MTTISNSLLSTLYGYNALTTASTGTASASTSVAKTSNAGLANTAVSLATDASLVGSLGGSAVALSATDILNSLAQAGTADSTKTSNSLDASIANSLTSSSDATTSGIYNASGTLTPITDTSSNWANVLKTNPELSSVVASISSDQAVVGTLSIYA